MAGAYTFEVPQEILDSARLSPKELKLELAIALYAQGRLSIGKARELAELSLWELRHVLAARRIPVHLDVGEVDQELSDLADIGSA